MKNLPKEKIDELFDDEDATRESILIGLYKIAYPDEWDSIKSVDGFPIISKETNLYICNRFIHWDHKNCPHLFAGGMWLNNGFKDEPGIPDWKVKPAPVTLKKVA